MSSVSWECDRLLSSEKQFANSLNSRLSPAVIGKAFAPCSEVTLICGLKSSFVELMRIEGMQNFVHSAYTMTDDSILLVAHLRYDSHMLQPDRADFMTIILVSFICRFMAMTGDSFDSKLGIKGVRAQ